MAQTSDELRADIERTREGMGDTVDALAYKADVPSRTKDWLGEKKDTVMSKVSGASQKLSENTPDGQDVTRRAAVLKSTAERNPLGLALAGAAVGFVAGVLMPTTEVEDERLGPMSDELKTTAVETGKEAVERAKVVAQEAGTTAMDTAIEVGNEQTEELAQSLHSQARGALTSEDPTRTIHG
jgi:gas vesicle protein